ncbi:MAG: protein kinase [Vicinamibacterales bacterium]
MPDPQVLNHYRILGPLGRGGMGEVYLAEDTRLHRKVALKILPAVMAADPERRIRFEREAQAVAAINHPNIVTIHSVEEADGVPFLTMELVEGKPFNEVMSSGALPLDVLLKTGIAISDAIAAAHQRGITHRDLKPGNVMVTADGRIKVLDFGLAKLREEQVAGSGDDVTRMPATDITGEGRIIGTVAYMSPEQAEGKDVDQRSDIFSLGVILHEMATGEKPFKGDTNVSVISAILKDSPLSITELNPSLPAGLSRVIRRSLAKDPSRRYQTATDLRNELEELKAEADSGLTSIAAGSGAAARTRSRAVSKVVVGCALAVVVAAAFGYSYWKKSATPDAPVTFAVDRFTRLTTSGNVFLAATSRDGRYVVHVKNTGATTSLWVRQTTTTSDVQIVAPAQVRYDGLTFSPEGDHVYYVTYSATGGVATLYRVPILGGTPQRVIEDIDSRISFSPDGKQVTFMRGAPGVGAAHVMIAAAEGTGARQLVSLSGADQFTLSAPSWSPDGKTILAGARSLTGVPQGLVFAVDVATGRMTRIENQWTFVGDIEWLPDGRSFAVAATGRDSGAAQIWQMPFPKGEPQRITNDLNSYVGVSLSADGTTLVTVQAETTSSLWVAPASELSSGRQVTTGRGRGDGLSGLSWAPDGRLVYGSVASGLPQVWISNADGSGAQQLTDERTPSMQPVVTPDGRYIVFQRFAAEGGNIWRIGVDGSNPMQLTKGPINLGPLADNAFVYYFSPSSGIPRSWKVPIDGGEPVSLGDYNFRGVALSSDHKRLLGVSWDDKARQSVMAILDLEGGGLQDLVGIPSFNTLWAPDGRALTFWAPHEGGSRLYRWVPGGEVPEVMATFPDSLLALAWSPDGKLAALARGQTSTDVVVITRKPRATE